MNIVDRVKNLITAPAKEWEVIKGESWTVADLFTKYAIILAGIPAIAGLIGYSLFGFSYGFGSFKLPIGTSITWAVLTYILSLVGVFVLGFIIDALAPSFGSTKDLVASLKVAVFSSTPGWVAGIINIFPSLSWIAAIASIYGLVLLYMGLQIVKVVPKEKMVGYFVVILIVAILVYVVIGLIMTSTVFSSYALSRFN
jgi:Yip1 domain